VSGRVPLGRRVAACHAAEQGGGVGEWGVREAGALAIGRGDEEREAGEVEGRGGGIDSHLPTAPQQQQQKR
jgi:hypothetical protein